MQQHLVSWSFSAKFSLKLFASEAIVRSDWRCIGSFRGKEVNCVLHKKCYKWQAYTLKSSQVVIKAVVFVKTAKVYDGKENFAFTVHFHKKKDSNPLQVYTTTIQSRRTGKEAAEKNSWCLGIVAFFSWWSSAPPSGFMLCSSGNLLKVKRFQASCCDVKLRWKRFVGCKTNLVVAGE